MGVELVIVFSNNLFNVYRVSSDIPSFTSDTVDSYFLYFPSQLEAYQFYLSESIFNALKIVMLGTFSYSTLDKSVFGVFLAMPRRLWNLSTLTRDLNLGPQQ